jgi:DinB superfamily
MKKILIILLFSVWVTLPTQAQNGSHDQRYTTDEDRAFLSKELLRTKELVIKFTKSLTKKQWSFKPTKESWNIGQVVEHLGLYERIFLQEAWLATELPPQPEFQKDALSDSIYLSWMAEPQAHKAPQNAVPLGFMKGVDNLTFFIFGRELILDFVSNTKKDLKVHFTPRQGEPNNKRSIHGLFVIHYSHTDRHLAQIRRIMSHPSFPK